MRYHCIIVGTLGTESLDFLCLYSGMYWRKTMNDVSTAGWVSAWTCVEHLHAAYVGFKLTLDIDVCQNTLPSLAIPKRASAAIHWIDPVLNFLKSLQRPGSDFQALGSGTAVTGPRQFPAQGVVRKVILYISPLRPLLERFLLFYILSSSIKIFITLGSGFSSILWKRSNVKVASGGAENRR